MSKKRKRKAAPKSLTVKCAVYIAAANVDAIKQAEATIGTILRRYSTAKERVAALNALSVIVSQRTDITNCNMTAPRS